MHKSKNLRNDSSDQIKRQNKKIKNIKIFIFRFVFLIIDN